MARKNFPNHIAVYTTLFAFTTLTRCEAAGHRKTPFVFPDTKITCDLFSLDEHMAYTAFAKDHGPVNLAFTFKACVLLHSKLKEARKKGVPVVMYSSPEPKIKSNMALLVALYWLIVEHEAPFNAFLPVASMEVMPFRDAGAGPFDFALYAQDILYGVHKALEIRLMDLGEFDARYYEYYETPSHGDLNILGPFIPFASPIESLWVAENRRRAQDPLCTKPPLKCAEASSLSRGFQCVLNVFKEQDVAVVVRLNEELRHFTNSGMEHVELYFDDGSNPTDEIVRNFIRLAEEVIENRGRKVAVHCKAGLGRTGVLIGAYFIYKYQFSAQEVMGFMRIVRPGMIVGPQQHYMVENQMKWVGWAARDALLKEISEQSTSGAFTPLLTPSSDMGLAVPPSGNLTPPDSATTPTFAAAAQQMQAKAAAQVVHHSAIPRSMSRPDLGNSGSLKLGDAVGQPRKTVTRVKSSTHIELDALPQIRTPSPDSGASRGTKRGKTPTSRNALGLTGQHLEAPRATLSRSSSVISTESQDDRPTKRHMLSSPLPPSSPPGTSTVTHSSTPAEPNVILMDTATKSVSVSRIPSRLRKMPSLATPAAIRKPTVPLAPSTHAGEAVSAPSRVYVTASSSPAPVSTTPKSAIPPRRTFLTSRAPPLPLRDLTAAPQITSQQRTPALGSKIPQPPPKAVTRIPTAPPLGVSGIKTPTARAKKVVSSLTPPRLGLGLLGIGKGATAAPVHSGREA